MKIQAPCLECMLRQVTRLMNRFQVEDRPRVYRDVFLEMARIDYNESAPVMWGNVWRIVREAIGTEDPYQETRRMYDGLLTLEAERFRDRIRADGNPFLYAVKLAIAGNLIDFAAAEPDREAVLRTMREAESMTLVRDETALLLERIRQAKILTVIGDNCGEIVPDRLLIEECRRVNPLLQVFYAVKGSAVVNDVTEREAYEVHMDDVAEIVSNGDGAAGTVLDRVSPEFLKIYRESDVVIAKGQGNYESLSEENGRETFCLLMAKCPHLAESFGVPPGSSLCVRLCPREEADERHGIFND